MFESNLSPLTPAARAASHGVCASLGLHAIVIGVLVLSYEPVVVGPRPTAAYQPVALVAPPPLRRQVRPLVKRPRLDAPKAMEGLAKERWTAAPLPERELRKFDPPAPTLTIAAEPPLLQQEAPYDSPVRLPEPEVRTGVFETGEISAADLPAPRPATLIGGFADPTASKDWRGAKLVARVGAFGPAGSDRSSRGAASNRQVAPAGFGEARGARATSAGLSGQVVSVGEAFESSRATGQDGPRAADVRATSFGAPTAPAAPPRRRAEPLPQRFDRDVEIVSKPRPQYTDEARKLGVEGEVVLEVLFGANGEVRVTRMVRGLGHGLDERAVEAASLISFRPAWRDGEAVDIVATVRIQFQLT